MSLSYKESPDGSSLLLAAKLLNIHLLNKAAKTREFCKKWHLDYFSIQMKNLNLRMREVFLELRKKYPCGKVVIFTAHCSFFGSLAQKGYLGYYIPDKNNPKIVLVDMITGEKEFHSQVFDVELKDLSSGRQKYQEF